MWLPTLHSQHRINGLKLNGGVQTNCSRMVESIVSVKGARELGYWDMMKLTYHSGHWNNPCEPREARDIPLGNETQPATQHNASENDCK